MTERTREVTPLLRTRSPMVCRQRERVIGFEEALNMEGSKIKRNIEGNRPSKVGAEENGRQEMNLSPLLAAHLGRNKNGQPLQSSLIYVHRVHQSSINIGENLPPNGTLLSHHAQPFIPSSAHQKSLRRRTWQFTASNKEKARVSELLPLDLPSTYKGLMEKTYTWIEAREVATNRTPNDQRDNFKRKCSQKLRAASLYVGKQAIKRHVLGSRRKGQKPSTANGERRKKKSITPAEAPILMINLKEAYTRNDISKSPTFEGREITFPPVTKGEKSWAIGEFLLEITIGDTPLSRSKTLNFVIVRTIMVNGKSFNTKQKLNYHRHIKPIKQKRQSLDPDHSRASRKEVEERIRAGILREAAHQTWVANSVMVKKSDGGWRMYVDFTDINKACPQRLLPSARDRLEGEGVYYYRKMPFGLKNTGVTYQRLVDKVFNDQIGRNLEAYVDDMSPTGSRAQLPYAGKTHASVDLEGKEYTYALRFEFKIINNEAEYEALLAGLRISQEIEIVNLAIFVDSQLLVTQIKGIYAAKQPAIRKYLQRTKETLRRFRSYTIEHIRRNHNKKSNALSKLASMTFEHHTKKVLVEVLARRSIEENGVLQVETKEEEIWMTPIHEYLLSGLLPEDSKESMKMKIKAPQYKLLRGSFYKKSFYTSWLRCIAPPKTDDVIKEIH
nr:reverse transcriptase domain-containing protein [Tanacetum cinerariifolium]